MYIVHYFHNNSLDKLSPQSLNEIFFFSKKTILSWFLVPYQSQWWILNSVDHILYQSEEGSMDRCNRNQYCYSVLHIEHHQNMGLENKLNHSLFYLRKFSFLSSKFIITGGTSRIILSDNPPTTYYLFQKRQISSKRR